MQNVVYFICDAYLLIQREVIIIFNFAQIVHNHNETIKYYASCFNKKSTKEIALYSVGLYLNMSDFLFQF